MKKLLIIAIALLLSACQGTKVPFKPDVPPEGKALVYFYGYGDVTDGKIVISLDGFSYVKYAFPVGPRYFWKKGLGGREKPVRLNLRAGEVFYLRGDDLNGSLRNATIEIAQPVLTNLSERNI